MAQVTLGIVLKNPAALAVSDDWLKLEQLPWEDKKGDDFESWLYTEGLAPSESAPLFRLHEKFRSGCAADGSFKTKIFVKTSRSDLEYELVADNGELSSEMIESQTVAKSYLVTEPSTVLSGFEGRIDTLHSYEWKMVFELVDGQYVSTYSPLVTVNEVGQPVWDRAVIGSLRLRFTAEVAYYELSVTPLDDTDDPEDSYQCTVMALWSGGPTTLEVEPPEAVGTCKGGTEFSVTDGSDDGGDGDGDGDGEGDEDQPSCYKLTIKVDACTKEKISEIRTPMECSEE